jgi:hypothetical protein
VYWQPLLSACMSFGDLLFHNGINQISHPQSSSSPSSPSSTSCKRLEPSGVTQPLLSVQYTIMQDSRHDRPNGPVAESASSIWTMMTWPTTLRKQNNTLNLEP